MLSLKNPHKRDASIVFEEAGHVYSVDNDIDYMSVTTFIHGFFPSFNPDLVIQKMKQSKGWTKNKYYGMSDDAIKKEWKTSGQEASRAGTQMHKNIENYYNGLNFLPEFKESKEHAYFQQFLADHPRHVAFRTEWPIYSKKYRLAGSVDMVYHDPDVSGKFIITDWKRCKEIKYENRWERGLGPLSSVENCNYWHYTLQLNLYRMMLEKNYSIQISKMFLVVLHPDQENYIKVPIPEVTAPILAMLKDRKTIVDDAVHANQREHLDTHNASNKRIRLENRCHQDCDTTRSISN